MSASKSKTKAHSVQMSQSTAQSNGLTQTSAASADGEQIRYTFDALEDLEGGWRIQTFTNPRPFGLTLLSLVLSLFGLGMLYLVLMDGVAFARLLIQFHAGVEEFVTSPWQTDFPLMLAWEAAVGILSTMLSYGFWRRKVWSHLLAVVLLLFHGAVVVILATEPALLEGVMAYSFLTASSIRRSASQQLFINWSILAYLYLIKNEFQEF